MEIDLQRVGGSRRWRVGLWIAVRLIGRRVGRGRSEKIQ
jgi:hypothetical protein